MRRIALALAPAVLLVGCASQIDGLAPVSGDTPRAIRTAAIDVLLQQKDTAPEVRAMAEAMRAAQMKEIGEMQKALEAYGR